LGKKGFWGLERWAHQCAPHARDGGTTQRGSNPGYIQSADPGSAPKGQAENKQLFWFKKHNSKLKKKKKKKEQISRNNSNTGPEGSLVVER
jgi:hypothetical protein